MRRAFLTALAALLLAASLATPTVAADAPNFILFYIDDLGYADTGAFGSKLNRTPNIDRLAAEGTRLTSFYASPVCTSSRTSLITGCYPKRVGMPGVLFPKGATGISAAEMLLPEYLKAEGYATMCVGKWHLGDQPEFLPTKHGFDHYFGLPYSNDMQKNPDKGDAKDPSGWVPLVRDDKAIEKISNEGQNALTARYTEEAVKFVRGHAAKPFFLYFPHTAVHVPLHPGDAFRGKSPHGEYSDWVEEMDWSIGEVMKTVRELGLEKKTFVLFASDNGGTKRGVNTPLSGFKAQTAEGGIRVSAIVWWPGQIPAGKTVDAIASTMDVLPTFVGRAGGKLSTDRKIDGVDLWPVLATDAAATSKPPRETFLYYHNSQLHAVRHGDWKLVIVDKQQPAPPRLYNLATDIGETTNVAEQHPDVVKQLQALIELAYADLGPNGKTGPGCRPAGHVEKPELLIPQE